ncbi:MAG: nucleoside phosphorylase [Erysipelotrichales bacterium]|nr:nucleoside phosphorylase [Erysipelotrichales bacterium]
MKRQSRNVLNEEGLQYHLHIKTGDIGKYVFLPGDPGRTDLIASYLDDAKLIAFNREHKTWTGFLDGEKVSVTSTGMGCPSTAIAVEELIHAGAEVLIRVGTCGRVSEESMDPRYEGVIITGAVRDEGTTLQYVPEGYPAIADRHVVDCLVKAAEESGHCFAEGLTQSKDSFYGELDPDSMPVSGMLKERFEAWKRAGVMATEMECSALFIIAGLRGARAGGIMSYEGMKESVIRTAVEGMRKIIRADKK